MPSIISKIQCAFVLDKHIINCVLVTYKIIHYLRNKRSGRKDFMSLKLDMSKTYNRVEWNYHEKVLVLMRFRDKLIKLIMTCV